MSALIEHFFLPLPFTTRRLIGRCWDRFETLTIGPVKFDLARNSPSLVQSALKMLAE